MPDKKNEKEKKKPVPFYKKTAYYGMLVALAMVLSYVESQIPVFIVIPGIKLGLTNLVVLTALYCMGAKDAFVINVFRIFLVGLTFANTYSMLYSLAGGILSFSCMLLLKKTGKFSVTGVSVAGGVAHNLGQLLVAAAVLSNSRLMYYFPVLLAAGTISGFAIGAAGAGLVKRLSCWEEF